MTKRRIITAVAAVLVYAPLTHTTTMRAADEPKRVEIVAKRFTYQPSDIVLKKDEPVVLVLKSEDVSHGLRCRELNLDLRLGKGRELEVPFTPTRTGDFVAHCSVFCGSGHGGMALTLHVVN